MTITFRPASLVAIATLTFAPFAAHAQDAEGLPPIEEALDREQQLEVIQNRKYDLQHELNFSVGALPTDPFYKGYTVNAAYVWHIWDLLAWEAVSFTYSFNVNTKLKDEVFRVALATGAREPAFPHIEWALASRVLFKPLYGKQAIFNTTVVHVEAFLQAGGDLLSVQGVRGRRGEARDRILAGFDFGGGLRLFVTELISFRLDLNEVIFFAPTTVLQALHIRLGLSMNLGFDD